jgi:pSer/pThr/pTyr-binding forkhead associated (FHA) protein
MALTVIVHLTAAKAARGPSSEASAEVRLTFDGTQRVVIGRGASSDVRLPDTSVSHRHATLRAQGSDFVIVDEGSANGTFVSGVRVAAHTSRIVRSGDRVRIGRMTIELVVEQAPVTRDVSLATRDLALAIVSRAMHPEEAAVRLRVVEGPDQGAVLSLSERGRIYLVGRGTHCDLALADADASREHAQVVLRGGQALLRDLGAKNGTWLGPGRAPANEEVLWRPAHLAKIGRTVIALEEPIADALAEIEAAVDEVMPAEPVAAPQVEAPPADIPLQPAQVAAAASVREPPPGTRPARPLRGGWSAADFAVMAAAAAVLVLSLAGLFWLLRGG